jgi:hypothetical protein
VNIIFNDKNKLTIGNSSFMECSVPSSGAGVGYGGAVYLYFPDLFELNNRFLLDGTIEFGYNNAKIGRDIYINGQVPLFFFQ